MDTGSVAKNKLLKWPLCTANGEIKLAFDPIFHVCVCFSNLWDYGSSQISWLIIMSKWLWIQRFRQIEMSKQLPCNS
jgi:hypothetical protein